MDEFDATIPGLSYAVASGDTFDIPLDEDSVYRPTVWCIIS